MSEKLKPVAISPNMVKETIFLDKNGNRVDKLRGGKIIQKAEEDPAPLPPPEPVVQEEQTTQVNPLASVIQQKVQEAVAKSISNIDIGKMVEDAITKSFGGK